MIARSLPYLWYPLFGGAAIYAFSAMLASGMPIGLAAYVPVIAVGIAIVVLEWRWPEHLQWRPRWSDIRSDAAFMALVQVTLPRLLALASVVGLAAWLHERTPSTWWPHQWPLAAQAVLMVLAVDFTRYWLHRACHRYDTLWRLHEVHHSPDVLYVLNVGRFHPFEKALHFCCDAMPFLALGVAPELIACYFVLYSVNGLFQHSNVRLRYGWLNYVVGSAQTHRWHHARDPRTAACNFGSTTIVWDIVFRTWRLPRGRDITDIGIMNRAYPRDFWGLMRAPFEPRAARRDQTVRARLTGALVKLRLAISQRIHEWRVGRLARDPMKAQRAVLARIVETNRDTTFGQRHAFTSITCIEDYMARVPVSDHEALRPYIDAELERGEASLTIENPEQYARTSGTTGRPKDVPLTRSHLRALRRIQAASVAFQYRTCPRAFDGAIVAIVSPAREGTLPNGKPFGSASGMVAGNTPRAVRDKFVVPPAVLTIRESRLKYLAILRLALGRRDVTYLGSANPTTLLTLMKLYREHELELLEDLRRGSLFCANEIPEDVMHTIAARLRADPDRAAELARLRASRGAVRISDLWPDLQMVVTWTCASAGIAVDALRRELSPRVRITELGYVSTEFRGTFTLGARTGSGFPTLDTYFFEFVERAAWDRGEPRFLTLDGVRKGVDYYVIVTTPSGLYRYFINDVVRVTGFLHRTPLFKFVQKGKGVTNITGEKLYEAQVLSAVRATLARWGGAPRFLMMLADEVDARYRLYIECDSGATPDAAELAAAVDEALREVNVEYDAKRESGRLGCLKAAWLVAAAGEAYKQHCVAQGQREGQFKMVALAYARDFHFDLDARVEVRNEA
jgi:sterol desaturase/sphingolipid hydroxylase (fatty acid hydroxylase superfamily)